MCTTNVRLIYQQGFPFKDMDILRKESFLTYEYWIQYEMERIRIQVLTRTGSGYDPAAKNRIKTEVGSAQN